MGTIATLVGQQQPALFAAIARLTHRCAKSTLSRRPGLLDRCPHDRARRFQLRFPVPDRSGPAQPFPSVGQNTPIKRVRRYRTEATKSRFGAHSRQLQRPDACEIMSVNQHDARHHCPAPTTSSPHDRRAYLEDRLNSRLLR